MKLKDAPIQRKLMSVILLTCLVVLLIMGTGTILLEFSAFRDGLKTNVTTLGTVIASNSSASLAFDSKKDATEILSALKAEKHIVAACLYDNAGNIFAKFPADTASAIFPSVEVKNGYRFESGYLIGFQPVVEEDKELGTLYLKSDLEAMYAQLRYFMLIGIFLIVGSLVIAFLLSKILQKSIADPIIALEKTAKIISYQRNYSVRATQYGKDEIGALTEAFNQMLNQIEAQNSAIITFNQQLEEKIKQRTIQLEDRNLFIETLFDTLEDNVAVFDTEYRYVAMNKKGEESYGMLESDIIGKNVLDVFPDVEKSGMYEKLKRAVNGETIHDISYYSPVIKRYLENFYIPLKNSKGEVYNVLLVGHDNTAVLEIAEKLKDANIQLMDKNAELLKSNRDLEQFAYIASHDLQEPLRKIQTFTSLLNQNLNNEQQLTKYLEKINQSSSRMQQLIQDVLNFSRVSNAQEAFVETDINVILENLKVDFELLIREKKAIIQYQKFPLITGVPLQLSQLFSNLISNSLKYSYVNTVIDISFKILSEEEADQYPGLSDMLEYIKIDVVDNGIGFEPQFREKIFDIFQRLHGKQAYSGTGIGLAICKKIVENHKGIIYAESEAGNGADFIIILPMKQPV